jgi:hypothetical protein
MVASGINQTAAARMTSWQEDLRQVLLEAGGTKARKTILLVDDVDLGDAPFVEAVQVCRWYTHM